MALDLKLLPEDLAVARLPAGSAIPFWAVSGTLRSVAWTEHETSIVCESANVPESVQSEVGWRALMVAGPLDFQLTGILLEIARPLARAGIPIFAISTFDTDYVLVKDAALETATQALIESGHRVHLQGRIGQAPGDAR